MTKTAQRTGWFCAALLCLLGTVVYLGMPGYSFSAYILLCIAGIIACYLLLKLLKQKKPRLSRVFFWILTVCLCLGLLAAGYTGVLIGKAAVNAPAQNCEYIIVLGAGVNGTTPSLSLRERLDAAYDYLAANPETVCIVSGGQGRGEEISEALCMYNDLTKRGIDPARVWMEDQASNTRENIVYSLDLIEKQTGIRPTTAGVVSSEYHLYRAGLFAGEQGLTAVGIPARTSWVTLRINYFLREIAAVWYYTLFGTL